MGISNVPKAYSGKHFTHCTRSSVSLIAYDAPQTCDVYGKTCCFLERKRPLPARQTLPFRGENVLKREQDSLR